MTEHDQRVCLATGQESRATTGQPRQDFARFEDVLTPKRVDAQLEAYMRADAAGDAQAATNVGVLLEEKGDLQGALAAYRRADRRGDVNGSFNLGCLLAEMGDVAGAEDALQRADARGDGAAASNLGVLLERKGDLERALAAYRRGDERGDALAAFNLGLLLAARGDVDGARAAYLRAAEGGDPEMGERAAQAEAELTPAALEPGARSEGKAEAVGLGPLLAPRRLRTRRVAALCLLALAVVLVARGLDRRR